MHFKIHTGKLHDPIFPKTPIFVENTGSEDDVFKTFRLQRIPHKLKPMIVDTASQQSNTTWPSDRTFHSAESELSTFFLIK